MNDTEHLLQTLREVEKVRLDLEQSRLYWKHRAKKAEHQLTLPCGSCHPCSFGAADTWKQLGLEVPSVTDYQHLVEANRDYQALCIDQHNEIEQLKNKLMRLREDYNDALTHYHDALERLAEKETDSDSPPH